MDKCRLAHGRLHFCTSFLHWRRELLSFCTYSFRTGAERAAGVDKIVDNLWIMYNLWIKLSTGVYKSVDKFVVQKQQKKIFSSSSRIPP